MKSYTPPFTITSLILKKIQEIQRLLGYLEGQQLTYIPLQLRREHQIKTIQASLAIEGNTLSLDQITAIVKGHKVIGPSKDILEVKNSLRLYENLSNYDPLKMKDLLKTHAILMDGLIEKAGIFRTGNVGIFKEKKLQHLAPPSNRVPFLIKDLFLFIQKNHEISWILKACIFHYEFEFIHPFEDGNGRMGRLWQQLLLMKEHPLFASIPVEVMIKEEQLSYYKALSKSDAMGESTPFLEFSLGIISDTLKRYSSSTRYTLKDAPSRLQYAQEKLKDIWFSRKDYLECHKSITSSTASRDLLLGLENNILIKQGSKNQTLYRFFIRDL